MLIICVFLCAPRLCAPQFAFSMFSSDSIGMWQVTSTRCHMTYFPLPVGL